MKNDLVDLAFLLAFDHAKNNTNCSHHGAILFCLGCNMIICMNNNHTDFHAEAYCTSFAQTHQETKQCLL